MKLQFTNQLQMIFGLTEAASAALISGVATAGSAAGQAVATGKLNKKNRKWQEKMYGIQRGDALEDWKRNNEYNAPEQQIERLKAAGLNPALMYGDAGAGGTTAQQPRSSDPGSWRPETPDIQAVGMGIGQAALLKAQIENINANTELTKTQAKKTGTVDTEETTARIQKIIAETSNEQAKNALLQLQTRAQQLENQFEAGTIEHRKGLVYEAYNQAEKTTGIINNQKDISDATKQTMIEQTKATLGDTMASIALKNEQVKKTIADTGLSQDLARKIFKETTWLDVMNEGENGMKKAYEQYQRRATTNNDMTISEQQYLSIIRSFVGATFDNMANPK